MSSSSRVKVALTRHLQQHALGLRSGTCARLLMANETRRCTDAPSRGSIIQVYRMGGMMEDDLARICCRAEEARPTDRPTRSVWGVWKCYVYCNRHTALNHTRTP